MEIPRNCMLPMSLIIDVLASNISDGEVVKSTQRGK